MCHWCSGQRFVLDQRPLLDIKVFAPGLDDDYQPVVRFCAITTAGGLFCGSSDNAASFKCVTA